ncbi:hypothetical protein QE152_g40403 [Popillia japonica]|uniref:Uncharacterized protein n=1 Tax=Popillia japonica TaxID=7064 RepID=A0AAW1HS04_POPJA
MESSDGYSTDEKKRKAEEEARTVFGTSKKTQRSPKLERKDGDKLDQILKLMTEMKSDQKLIKEEAGPNIEINDRNEIRSETHKRRNTLQ